MAPKNPLYSLYGSSFKFTVANPASIPALVNSVIPCGMRGLSGLFVLSYMPKSGEPLYPFENPEIFVESAKSALMAITNGRPYSSIDFELI